MEHSYLKRFVILLRQYVKMSMVGVPDANINSGKRKHFLLHKYIVDKRNQIVNVYAHFAFVVT